MTKIQLFDWLFRIGLYRGTKSNPPKELIRVGFTHEGNNVDAYTTELNPMIEITNWLDIECEGPWALRLQRPYKNRQAYIAFARKTDAAIFRIMTA